MTAILLKTLKKKRKNNKTKIKKINLVWVMNIWKSGLGENGDFFIFYFFSPLLLNKKPFRKC